MKRRLLFTLGLLLFLSGIASSNERACPGHETRVKCPKAVTRTSAESEYHTLLINKLLYI